jgi:excinuclease ABC subunit B
MPAFKVHATYEPAGDQPQAIKALTQWIGSGTKFQTLLGITGSGKTHSVARVVERVQKPTLVVSHNKTLAAQLYEELKAFFPENAVEYFVSYYDYYQPEAYVPQTDTYIAKEVDINREIERLRFSATQSLLSRRDVIVVASVSCIYGLGNPESYRNEVVMLQAGMELRRDELLARLVNVHYTRNDFELKPGVFRAKGDVVDVQQPGDDYVTRVEFWGNKVERLAEVDPVAGKVQRELRQVTIFPGRHFLVPEGLDAALDRIEKELQAQLAEFRARGKLLEAQRLEQRTKFDLEMLRNLGTCSGVENYSRPLSGRSPGDPGWCLLDYFPKDYLMVIDESHITVPQFRAMYNGDRARKEILVEHGFRLPSALDNRPLKFDELERKMPQVLFVSATPGPYEFQKSGDHVAEQIVRPTGLVDPEVEVRATKGQIDDLLAECRTRAGRGERVLVTTLTKKMAEDLTEFFRGLNVRVEYLHSDVETLERIFLLESLRRGEFDVLVGINLLREGLDLPEVSLVAILDADKYGFLRSETSLIQTIGRAARNVHGKVLMYADQVTPAMATAIDVTNTRRERQIAYNEAHGIVPRTVVRPIKSLEAQGGERRRTKAPAPSPLPLLRKAKKDLTPDERAQVIAVLEKEMHAAAKNLEFEKAALLRDKLVELRA